MDHQERTPLLQVTGVSVRAGGQDILRQVSLEVGPAEVVALLGLDGSGKSSLAYTLMGCGGYIPSEGRIEFAGQDITRASITARARLGLTLAWQEPARFEGLPVGAYLALGAAEGHKTLDHIVGILAAVRLSPRVYLSRPVDGTLSGGERKRIEIAAVVAMRPKLAILDEPDSGVDVLALEDLKTLIRQTAGQGTAVLLITHRDELAAMADRVALMCLGTIVAWGSPQEVVPHYRQRCAVHTEMASIQAAGGNAW